MYSCSWKWNEELSQENKFKNFLCTYVLTLSMVNIVLNHTIIKNKK